MTKKERTTMIKALTEKAEMEYYHWFLFAQSTDEKDKKEHKAWHSRYMAAVDTLLQLMLELGFSEEEVDYITDNVFKKMYDLFN